jgi:hypothetical protein
MTPLFCPIIPVEFTIRTYFKREKTDVHCSVIYSKYTWKLYNCLMIIDSKGNILAAIKEIVITSVVAHVCSLSYSGACSRGMT